MAAPHNLHWNPLFSHQMICKQYIILNHVFFQYKSNLEIRTCYINETIDGYLKTEMTDRGLKTLEHKWDTQA